MEHMVLTTIEAVRAGSKPPAADDSIRTPMGGICGFGASAPLLIRAAPMHFSTAEGSAIMPKLVKLVGPSSTFAEELSPLCFARFSAASFVRLRVFMPSSTSASVVRRGCRASCCMSAKR